MSKYNGLIFACVCMSLCFRQVNAETPDPTRPLGFVNQTLGTVGAGPATIELNSILIAKDRKVAIINGQTLHENQTIKGIGAQVKKIDADAVTLQQGAKVWRLPLNQTIVRK